MSFVRIGPDDFLDDTEEIAVDEIIINPRFRRLDTGTFEYDFAVLRLKEKSVTTPINININPRFPSAGGTPLETIGYGEDELFEKAIFLNAVDLDLVPFGTCQADFYPDISQNLHLCTIGNETANQGPCAGK